MSNYRVFAELGLFDNLQWWHQIAIAGNQEAEIVAVQISVIDDLAGDVDVGFLLFKEFMLCLAALEAPGFRQEASIKNLQLKSARIP